MDDTLAAALILTLAVWAALSSWAYRNGYKKLLFKHKYLLEHGMKPATGSYCVTMPESEWNESVRIGAFALAVKDIKGEVILTIQVVKTRKMQEGECPQALKVEEK